MQTPIFDHYRVDPHKFWQEVNELPNYYRQSGLDLIVPDTIYLNHFITYARAGIFKGLNNRRLRKFGAEIEFYKAPRSCKIISQIAYALDNTTKTRAIFEINKGTNKIADIEVNAKIPDEDRRVPIQNMIYIADGPSNVPVFSIVNRFGGRTFAVYQPGSREEFSQVNRLQKQGRVQSYGEADYSQGSQTAMWIENAVSEIAEFIVTNRQRALGEKIGKPPKHLD